MSHHTRNDLKASADEDATYCGLCGICIYQATRYGNLALNSDIRQAYGSAARVQVSLTVGEDDFDMHAGETSSYDICPRCFEEKLKPWFDKQGAKLKVEQWIS